MASVFEVIQRLLPAGTGLPFDEHEPISVDWRTPPLWPPDLFAVAATLVNLSGCYAHSAVTEPLVGWSEHLTHGLDPEVEYVARVQSLGKLWRTQSSGDDRRRLQGRLDMLWSELLKASAATAAGEMPRLFPRWCAAALELMAIADEASAGIGFSGESPFAAVVLERHLQHLDLAGPGAVASPRRRAATSTLCILVPPDECCVQPKGRTPQVGCTLRNVSHHLALMPPAGEVTTRYLIRPRPTQRTSLNLLLVPFPYEVRDDCITWGNVHETEGWGNFVLKQNWMPDGATVEESASAFARFVTELIKQAEKNTGEQVHGVVLPEQSLSEEHAGLIGDLLAGENDALEFFAAGVLVNRAVQGKLPGNEVVVRLYQQGDIVSLWQQPKHHRWRLTDGQAKGYGLAPPRSGLSWWEGIEVMNRTVTVARFHEGGFLACLVCEDLARMEPVHPVIRAIGPSLIVAVLFDGPQLPGRWAAHAAAGLAEDPGSSVLVLTSMAPARRWWKSAASDEKKRIEVGLWRDGLRPDVRLEMDEDEHALFLPLTMQYVEERTLDRRSDGKSALVVTADRARGVTTVTHPDPPPWLTQAGRDLNATAKKRGSREKPKGRNHAGRVPGEQRHVREAGARAARRKKE